MAPRCGVRSEGVSGGPLEVTSGVHYWGWILAYARTLKDYQSKAEFGPWSNIGHCTCMHVGAYRRGCRGNARPSKGHAIDMQDRWKDTDSKASD